MLPGFLEAGWLALSANVKKKKKFAWFGLLRRGEKEEEVKVFLLLLSPAYVAELHSYVVRFSSPACVS